MEFTYKQIEHIKKLAKQLIDDGSNKEYTRGICELIAGIDGIPDVFLDERSEQIKEELLTPAK